MRPALFSIKRAGPGRLATITRPRSGDWLADEMHDLAQADVQVLVSLLTCSEATELGLAQERPIAQVAGIEFHQLPTPDRQIPDRAAMLALARLLRQRLDDGASIVVHCRHAIGRSPTLAAAMLVLEGIEPPDAWDRRGRHRPG